MADALKILLACVSFASASVMARPVCYRSDNSVGHQVEGYQQNGTLTLMWSPEGLEIERLALNGARGKVENELLCSERPPINCTLGGDGGGFALFFEENKAKIRINGNLTVRADESHSSDLAVRPNPRITRVIDLVQISAEECRKAFPDQGQIKVETLDTPFVTPTLPADSGGTR